MAIVKVFHNDVNTFLREAISVDNPIRIGGEIREMNDDSIVGIIRATFLARLEWVIELHETILAIIKEPNLSLSEAHEKLTAKITEKIEFFTEEFKQEGFNVKPFSFYTIK